MRAKYEIEAMKIRMDNAVEVAKKECDADGLLRRRHPITDQIVISDPITAFSSLRMLLDWISQDPRTEHSIFDLTDDELAEGLKKG